MTPNECATLSDCLNDALAERGISARQASLAIGRSQSTVGRIMCTGSASRPTLRLLEDYFGMNRGELVALRPRSEAHVAAGKAVAARLGLEYMRALAATARAAFSADERRQVAERDRGLHATVMRRAWSNHPEAFRANQARIAAQARNSEERACLFCHQPISRPLSHFRRRGVYHSKCFAEWRRTTSQRTYAQSLGTLSWIWRQVKANGSMGLQRRIRAQMPAAARRLRGSNRPGRKAKLFEHKDAAIWAAIMHVQYGTTALEIGRAVGFASVTLPTSSGGEYQAAGQATWELIAFGRALLKL